MVSLPIQMILKIKSGHCNRALIEHTPLTNTLIEQTPIDQIP